MKKELRVAKTILAITILFRAIAIYSFSNYQFLFYQMKLLKNVIFINNFFLYKSIEGCHIRKMLEVAKFPINLKILGF